MSSMSYVFGERAEHGTRDGNVFRSEIRLLTSAATILELMLAGPAVRSPVFDSVFPAA